MTAEYSVVLAGRYGVGKTTLFKKLKNGRVPDGLVEAHNSQRSISDEDSGVDSLFYSKKVNGRNIRVTLWDTGGQERHDSLTANYYRNAHAVILVYALDEENTLYALSEWVKEAMEMNRQGDRLVLALWGTKADLPSIQKTVKQEAVEALKRRFNIGSKLNCWVSVFDGSLEEAMLHLMEHVDCQFGAAPCIDDPEMRRLNSISETKTTSTTTDTTTTTRWRGCCGQ